MSRVVHWISADQAVAVVDCGDLEVGVLRTQNRATVEGAKALLTPGAGPHWQPHRGGGHGFYAVVHTADVPWTRGYTQTPTVSRKAGARIEDWPARCPKCGRDKSAVLLFSSWDCRHGCFSRGAVQG